MSSAELAAVIDEVESLFHASNYHSVLTSQQKESIIKSKPTSITDLKKAVIKYKEEMANTKGSTTEKTFVSAILSHDPLVNKGLTLGRKSVGNKELLSALWDHFSNPLDLALAIGVSESTVRRRQRRWESRLFKRERFRRERISPSFSSAKGNSVRE